MMSPTTIAQTISRVLDDAIAEGEAFAPDADRDEDTFDFIAEVGAQLHHLLGGNTEFTVTAGNGQVFTIRVSEES